MSVCVCIGICTCAAAAVVVLAATYYNYTKIPVIDTSISEKEIEF